MNRTALTKEITYHEGLVKKVYLDSLGYKTAGVGHLLVGAEKDLAVGTAVSDEQIAKWLEHDIQDAINKATNWLGQAFEDMDEVRQRIIVSFAFNLGNRIQQFKTMKAALLLQRYDLAANSMENSLWFKQVGRRGPDMCNAMRTGVIHH